MHVLKQSKTVSVVHSVMSESIVEPQNKQVVASTVNVWYNCVSENSFLKKKWKNAH